MSPSTKSPSSTSSPSRPGPTRKAASRSATPPTFKATLALHGRSSLAAPVAATTTEHAYVTPAEPPSLQEVGFPESKPISIPGRTRSNLRASTFRRHNLLGKPAWPSRRSGSIFDSGASSAPALPSLLKTRRKVQVASSAAQTRWSSDSSASDASSSEGTEGNSLAPRQKLNRLNTFSKMVGTPNAVRRHKTNDGSIETSTATSASTSASISPMAETSEILQNNPEVIFPASELSSAPAPIPDQSNEHISRECSDLGVRSPIDAGASSFSSGSGAEDVSQDRTIITPGSINPVSDYLSQSAQLSELSLATDSMTLVDDIGLAITSMASIPLRINGHFCDLFEGTHIKAGKVALKRPRIGATGYDDVILRRFEREAATWRGLRHPHILEFLGTFKRDGHIYFVSPFITNGTLVEYIAAHPNVHRIRLLGETADAVQYLHMEGVVHGDLKANNILIHDDGYSLLCDFGLTKTIESRTSTAMQGAGTLRWQSPELWNNVPKTFKSDVYAFGMTIAEVLTGKVPFSDIITDGAVLYAVMIKGERPPKIPTESPGGISYENIWDVATASWPTNPADRISMSEAFHRIRADPSLT